jgi:hypothetical protein
MASSLNTPIDVDSEVAMATVSAEDPGAKRQSQRKDQLLLHAQAGLDEEMMDVDFNFNYNYKEGCGSHRNKQAALRSHR